MRRRRPERRKILPDPIFSDLIVAKFVNNLMLDGKKSIAEKLFYSSLDIFSFKSDSFTGSFEPKIIASTIL